MSESAKLQLGFDMDTGVSKLSPASSVLPIWKPGK
jgi:hypothetical protein